MNTDILQRVNNLERLTKLIPSRFALSEGKPYLIDEWDGAQSIAINRVVRWTGTAWVLAHSDDCQFLDATSMLGLTLAVTATHLSVLVWGKYKFPILEVPPQSPLPTEPAFHSGKVYWLKNGTSGEKTDDLTLVFPSLTVLTGVQLCKAYQGGWIIWDPIACVNVALCDNDQYLIAAYKLPGQ